MESLTIAANGIKQHVRVHGNGPHTVLFVHGNGSDAVFWRTLMEQLPEGYMGIAPDLRGYGHTEAAPCDATRSFGTFVDDLTALMDKLDIASYHFVGHSLGGGIGWELMLRDSARMRSATYINPASPFGFGGSKDEKGTPTFPDGAGSGAGLVNPDFVRLLAAQDRSESDPSSPVNVMNAFYWAPPFVPENADELLDGLLRMQIGEKFYPGDSAPSENFPFSAPGKFGQINAASPLTKQGILEKLVDLYKKPPVLWVRGSKDLIVSDHSLFDTAVHGAAGHIPGWPGAAICPLQPMVAQTRYVLEAYKKAGGQYLEMVMRSCGHSPYLENPADFNPAFFSWLKSHA